MFYKTWSYHVLINSDDSKIIHPKIRNVRYSPDDEIYSNVNLDFIFMCRLDRAALNCFHVTSKESDEKSLR